MAKILSTAPTRAKRRAHRSREERRRIVELSFRDGASINEIAIAHDVAPASLSHWRSMYRSGKLDVRRSSHATAGVLPSTAFLPVTLATTNTAVAAPSKASEHPALYMRERTIVQLTLPSGATLRIESSALDATHIGALLAEIRT